MRVRQLMFKSLINTDIAYFDTSKTGDLVSRYDIYILWHSLYDHFMVSFVLIPLQRLGSDSVALGKLFTEKIVSGARNIVTAAASFSIMMFYSPYLTGIMIAMIAPSREFLSSLVCSAPLCCSCSSLQLCSNIVICMLLYPRSFACFFFFFFFFFVLQCRSGYLRMAASPNAYPVRYRRHWAHLLAGLRCDLDGVRFVVAMFAFHVLFVFLFLI